MNKIRTAVIGGGKMGSIHARVYSTLDTAELIAIVDTDKQRAEKLAAEFNCKALSGYEELIGSVDAVTISTPTQAHYEVAKTFITAGVAVMIEKPLAASIQQGKEIVALAEKHKVVVAVGHSERCNPVVQAVKRLNIEPKFIEAHRISPYPFRSTDIGVVMDVMIHDIDIILSLAGGKVKSVDAAAINVIADNEDICNVRIAFDNGCVANITASRLALKTERKVRLFSRQAYLSLDYFKKEGIVIKAAPNVDVVNWIRQQQQNESFDFANVNWPDMLHIEQLDIEDGEPLRLEQQAFLKAVADKDSQPEVTAEDALAAMQCAEMILESARNHKWD
jgi:predicted dehydrogenase